MLHWTIWGKEPGVHEASLRRYGSKLVYHITVYFLFTLVTVTCKYRILTQLTYHFASYNSSSNWRPPKSMQACHRRARFCRTLTNDPGVFWITGFTDPRLHTSNCSVEHPLWGPCSQLFKTHQGYFSECGSILYADVMFALRLVAVNLSNYCKMQNGTLILSMYCICR